MCPYGGHASESVVQVQMREESGGDALLAVSLGGFVVLCFVFSVRWKCGSVVFDCVFRWSC